VGKDKENVTSRSECVKLNRDKDTKKVSCVSQLLFITLVHTPRKKEKKKKTYLIVYIYIYIYIQSSIILKTNIFLVIIGLD